MDRRTLGIVLVCSGGCIGDAKNSGTVIIHPASQPSTQPTMGTEVKQTQGTVAVGTGVESKMTSPTFNIHLEGGGWTMLLMLFGIAIIAAAAYVFQSRKAASADGTGAQQPPVRK